MRAVCWEGPEKIQVETVPEYMPVLLERIERGEIDPSFIITHRIGLEDVPSMYRTFRDKHDACIKVVMTPGGATPHHPNSPPSRQE